MNKNRTAVGRLMSAWLGMLFPLLLVVIIQRIEAVVEPQVFHSTLASLIPAAFATLADRLLGTRHPRGLHAHVAASAPLLPAQEVLKSPFGFLGLVPPRPSVFFQRVDVLSPSPSEHASSLS